MTGDPRTLLQELGLSWVDLDESQRHELDTQGFTVVPDVIDAGWLSQLRRAFEEICEQEGDRAGMEVAQMDGTRRLADLVNKGSSVFDQVYLRPVLLAAVYHVLQRPFKLHSVNGHDPLPGHGQQELHTDWGGDRSAAHVVNSMWMLDDFTPDNGSTRVVPGTHLLPGGIRSHLQDRLAPHPEEVHMIGSAGSVGIFNGNLWHSCTVNRTDAKRRTLHCAFIAREHPQQTDQREYLQSETDHRLNPLARYILDV